MFLAQFPPPMYPCGPSSRIDDAMARFATQHVIFNQIIDNWGQILDEWMTDYIERFDQNVIQECPYRLSENHRCHLFWCGVPFSISIYANYDLYDYRNLKNKMIQVEKEMLHERRAEEDPENVPEENSDETTN